MNPLLFLLVLAAVITLSLVACVRAFMEFGVRRLLWLGVVVVIALITLGSLVIA